MVMEEKSDYSDLPLPPLGFVLVVHVHAAVALLPSSLQRACNDV
jgi:hypothetical protein